MRLKREREDLSRFLVHLTRDYGNSLARNNLLSILKRRKIFARNAHCLVSPKIKNMGFSKILTIKFNTVCFTETPLTQIKQLVSDIENRKIKLKPYGLVFWRDVLFDEGASPAIYINAKGTSVSKFLLDEFDTIFQNITTFKKLKKIEVQHYENIVHYYSLINVVKDEHDFLWEREWRFHGSFTFEYKDIVAIIAKNPDSFATLCEKKLDKETLNYVRRLPIISLKWNYEELMEEFAIKIWEKKP